MVTESQATRGSVFKALVDPRCLNCSFYTVCSKNLKPGWRYRVLSVRNMSHICPILSEKMYVVEVEEAPLRAVVESKVAIAGLKFQYRRITCSERACKFRSYCNQASLLDGENVRVVGVRDRIKCPRGCHLTFAELLPAE